MLLIIMRHGQSLSAEFLDSDNQLTERGIRETLEAGGLIRNTPGLDKIDRIYTSPFKRAVQTAELLDLNVRPIEIDDMTPSNTFSVDALDELVSIEDNQTVVVVGHDDFVSKVMNKKFHKKYISLKTGGYAIIAVSGNQWDLLQLHRDRTDHHHRRDTD